ncbi:MAG: sensor histidine kinase [Sphingobacteriaceae bacterium]|nr:MAG: sensor histidine kinase [Sphingobacteriaceae bacterium]
MFPIPKNEDERLESLRSYQILDTEEENDFDELAMLASAICQTPIALITLVDDKRQWFKSHRGTDIRETPREISFCAHAIAADDDIMIINDTRKDERFVDNPLVTGDTNLAFYAGVPLVNEEGFALGTLCVIDQQVKQLTDKQAEALKVLAKQVTIKLELKKKVLVLEEKNRELTEVNSFVQKFAITAAHDLKNPLSSIMLTSQALKVRLDKLGDIGCHKLVDLNITSSVKLMNLVDEMLAYSKSPANLLSEKREIDLNEALNKILCLIHIPDNIKIVAPEEKHTLHISSVALEQILLNLITNAIRYNDKEEGVINISFNETGDAYQLQIRDNGIGIEEQYLDKIFANNFTLKITDRYNKQGTGVGLATVKNLLNVLKGEINVTSVPTQWTNFLITVKK